jgi:Phage ABA sandwich domain
MTTAAFLALTPREQDAIVAEIVMGYSKVAEPKGGWLNPFKYYISSDDVAAYEHDRLPHFSTSISAAWTVMEDIGNTKALFYHDAYSQWECRFDKSRCIYEDCRITVMADTAPLAICLVALKAEGFIND